MAQAEALGAVTPRSPSWWPRPRTCLHLSLVLRGPFEVQMPPGKPNGAFISNLDYPEPPCPSRPPLSLSVSPPSFLLSLFLQAALSTMTSEAII